MRHAFALIDYTQASQTPKVEKNRQGRAIRKTPNVYFEVSSCLELRTQIASLQFEGTRVLRIYHKPVYHKLGDWVLVGPLNLDSSYGTAIERPLLSKGFARELWHCALGRLALKQQQDAQLQARGGSRVAHVQTAVILPFERLGERSG